MPLALSPELLFLAAAVLMVGISVFVLGRLLRFLFTLSIIVLAVWVVLSKGPELKTSWCRNSSTTNQQLSGWFCRYR